MTPGPERMGPPVFVNGRFLSQPVTGVQRFSHEITAAIGRLISRDAWPETEVLIPNRPQMHAPGVAGTPGAGLRLRAVGRTRGHLWEQTELPFAARGGVLLGLGNTGPVLAGSRQVVVIHDAGVFDVPASYSASFRAWYRTLQRWLVRNGAHIVTVSRFSRNRIAARLDIDPSGIAVTYEGADHILRVAADPSTLERYGLHRGRFALVVGGQVGHKNLDVLSQLAAVLEQRDMTLAVVGSSGPAVFATPTAGAAAIGRGLGRVTDAELRCLYESAACLLFPSRYEGFGLPPIEAMACGCPVIAARGGAVEEVCGNGALYFDPQDPHSLADVSHGLFDDADLAEGLRARGVTRAGAFSWESAARVLGGVVQRLQ